MRLVKIIPAKITTGGPLNTDASGFTVSVTYDFNFSIGKKPPNYSASTLVGYIESAALAVASNQFLSTMTKALKVRKTP